jgi:hypothetical protein
MSDELIMVGALWTRKKAKRVTDTEVRLAAHGATEQRFEENGLAKAIVAWGRGIWSLLGRMAPPSMKTLSNRRTAPPAPEAWTPPYDRLRATVNLTVASMLISLGTASGLPLSTTYITFMAAMGAALGDRVWKSHDAEQRVAGILMVLGGWLITGFIAAAGAFVMASFIALAGATGVFVAVGFVVLGLSRMRAVRTLEPDQG